MKFSEKFLIGMVVWHILLTATFLIIFWYKNVVPIEIYVCQVPPLITEFFILYKLEIDKRSREYSCQPICNEVGKNMKPSK